MVGAETPSLFLNGRSGYGGWARRDDNQSRSRGDRWRLRHVWCRRLRRVGADVDDGGGGKENASSTDSPRDGVSANGKRQQQLSFARGCRRRDRAGRRRLWFVLQSFLLLALAALGLPKIGQVIKE